MLDVFGCIWLPRAFDDPHAHGDEAILYGSESQEKLQSSDHRGLASRDEACDGKPVLQAALTYSPRKAKCSGRCNTKEKDQTDTVEIQVFLYMHPPSGVKVWFKPRGLGAHQHG